MRDRDVVLCPQRLDFVIDSALVLELKSVELLTDVHEAQTLSYLKVSALRIALLVNFNVAVLKDGVRRFAFTSCPSAVL